MPGILDTFGIQNFYDTASRKDFARQNLFRVIQLGNTDIDDLLYMTSASVPSRAIANITTPYMGLQFNVPGDANYPGSDAWAVKFRMPTGWDIRNKLEAWSKFIFDDQNSTGAYEIPDGSSANKIIMALIDKVGNPVKYYTFFGAWLQNIGQVEMQITTQGEIVEQSATMAYQFWRDGVV